MLVLILNLWVQHLLQEHAGILFHFPTLQPNGDSNRIIRLLRLTILTKMKLRKKHRKKKEKIKRKKRYSRAIKRNETWNKGKNNLFKV